MAVMNFPPKKPMLGVITEKAGKGDHLAIDVLMIYQKQKVCFVRLQVCRL